MRFVCFGSVYLHFGTFSVRFCYVFGVLLFLPIFYWLGLPPVGTSFGSLRLQLFKTSKAIGCFSQAFAKALPRHLRSSPNRWEPPHFGTPNLERCLSQRELLEITSSGAQIGEFLFPIKTTENSSKKQKPLKPEN